MEMDESGRNVSPAAEMLQETNRSRGAGEAFWRRLPTAWIHFFVVECVHMYASGYAWRRLINTINTNCSMRSYYSTTAKIENYFASLYFIGSADEINLTLSNVTDANFLAEGDFVYFTPSLLTLPTTTIQGGVNTVWLLVAWSFPLVLFLLLSYITISMAKLRIWSFDDTAYLNYTLHLYRRKPYQAIIKALILPPIILPIMWVIQMIMYQLWDQIAVFRSETLSGIILVWGVYGLAHPQPSAHRWTSREEFLELGLLFKRPMLHLFFSQNKTFGLKFVDALWTAKHGDHSRLERYLCDPTRSVTVLEICERAQLLETEVMLERARS